MKNVLLLLVGLVLIHMTSYIALRSVGIYRIESGDMDRSMKWVSFDLVPIRSWKFKCVMWLSDSVVNNSFYVSKHFFYNSIWFCIRCCICIFLQNLLVII